MHTQTANGHLDAYHAEIEELARRYVTLEELTRKKNYPDADMDGLVVASNNILKAIVAAPIQTADDYRGKLRVLLDIAGNDLDDSEPTELFIDLAKQVNSCCVFNDA
jgi:hypothetical protein